MILKLLYEKLVPNKVNKSTKLSAKKLKYLKKPKMPKLITMLNVRYSFFFLASSE